MRGTSRTAAEKAALQAALYRLHAEYYVLINGTWWPLERKVFPRSGRFEPSAWWHVPVGGDVPMIGFNDKAFERKLQEGTIRRGREVLR